MQLGFYFDQSRCIGCYNCVAACRSWNKIDPENPDLIIILKQELGEFPDLSMTHLFFTCFHCAEPICVQACPEQIFKKRSEDGIVIVSDPERCTRCELCIESCPFDAPKILKRSAQNILKCNLCLDRLEMARPTACVSSCPTEALDVATVSELKVKYGELRELEGFPDCSITGPAIIFRAMQPK